MADSDVVVEGWTVRRNPLSGKWYACVPNLMPKALAFIRENGQLLAMGEPPQSVIEKLRELEKP